MSRDFRGVPRHVDTQGNVFTRKSTHAGFSHRALADLGQNPGILVVLSRNRRRLAQMIEATDRGVEIFWGEISPCEHLVQIYHDDAVFLDALEGFVAGGIKAGEAVIVIATSPHLNTLEQRLAAAGINLNAARASRQYIPLNARETLERFVFNGHPDEERFEMVIGSVLHDARSGSRKVRAFGEMVALMWAQGHHAGTFKLEKLWHRLCEKEAFSLFCAYPRAGFTEDLASSAQSICDEHSRVIGSVGRAGFAIAG